MALTLALAVVVLGGCSRGGGGSGASIDDTTTPSIAADGTTAGSATIAATPDTGGDSGGGGDGGGVSIPSDPTALCAGLTVGRTGQVATGDLEELSGLAPSGRQPGLLWAHNDSGNDVVLHALDLDGAELGAVTVDGVDATDIEDMAIAGGSVYLADIGDNDRQRSEIAVHRFPEPDPGAGSVPASDVETLRFRYPDRAHDAEALLIDPVDGTLLIVPKEIAFGAGENGTLVVAAEAPLYVADPPFQAGEVRELRIDGAVALDELDRLIEGQGPQEGLVADLGGAGVATGADVRSDGAVIAVRTYEAVWLFARPAGTSLAEALAGEPCPAPVEREPQGEAVAFLDGTSSAFVTISELDPAIHVTRAG